MLGRKNTNKLKVLGTRCIFILGLVFLVSGCNFPTEKVSSPLQPAESDPTDSPAKPSALPAQPPTATDTIAPSPTPTPSFTPSPTVSPTETSVPTQTNTASPEPTATIPPSATAARPQVQADVNSNCRLGPGEIYHYSTVIYASELADLDGKNFAQTWYWVQTESISFHCWVAASLVTVQGNFDQVPFIDPPLPTNSSVDKPANVKAQRNGDTVSISWNSVAFAEDYLLEFRVCQNTFLVDLAFVAKGSSFSIRDEGACSGAREGLLFAHNMLGYSPPVVVPWP